MKKLPKLLIIVSYVLSVVYCKLEVPPEEPEKNILIEEIEIMNDFIVKPFTEYPAYFVQGNAVSGIPADAKVPIDLLRFLPELEINNEYALGIFDQFFVKDGKVHFTVSAHFPVDEETGEVQVITKYCTLKDGEISYLTKAKFPEMPDSGRATGTTGEYNIDIGDYKGEPISIASRDYAENFLMIDGFIEIEGGLLIHTPSGRGSSRPPGLLFWPEGLRTMNPWKEVGRFWK